ncbi:hypothetical protein, partial [Acidithiobacillus ferrianus]|uniref:hypothetical protein n=1 Tax=Acidithiobacillus ferrianus TaxID=2678518 RepID=UPI0034E53AB4
MVKSQLLAKDFHLLPRQNSFHFFLERLHGSFIDPKVVHVRLLTTECKYPHGQGLTVKYEHVYLNPADNGMALRCGLKAY